MKKCVVINDFTTCSEIALGIQMPILRELGIECLPVPTKMLSYPLCNETSVALSTFNFAKSMIDSWTKAGDTFDAVLTGFIPDVELVDIVAEFLIKQKERGAIIIVDPVMGDNGHAYKSVTSGYIEAMKRLVSIADVILPNYTEACILTGTEYEEAVSGNTVNKLLCCLQELGAKTPVITGVFADGKDVIACLLKEKGMTCTGFERVGGQPFGTGDRFAAVLTGMLLKDKSMEEAISEAADSVTAFLKNRL